MKISRIKKIPIVFILCLVIFFIFPACSQKDFATSCSPKNYVLTCPDYYKFHMRQKLEKIEKVADKNTITESFFFITDLHWNVANSHYSPVLMHDIKANMGINLCILGGDYEWYDRSDKNESLAIIDECIASFSEFERYAIAGNHETNVTDHIDQINNKRMVITPEELAPHMNAGYTETYFTIDEADIKLRKIFLNTNIFVDNEVQQNFLKDALLSLDDDWTALIFMHIYKDYSHHGEEPGLDPNGVKMEEILVEIKPQLKCSVAAIFSGHVHYDFDLVNKAGVNVIATSCDAIYGKSELDASVRNKGQFTEQAFDVVQLDLSARKIFLTRIGAGRDRQFSY